MSQEQTFGNYIKGLRVEKGLTLTQLAAQLGLDSANLCKIENDKRTYDERRLDKIAFVFNIDIAIVKMEFFSGLFARKIIENNCSLETLSMAEEKVAYLKNKNTKQCELRFDQK